MKAIITTPVTIWIKAENEEEAIKRFKKGSWHKVDTNNFDNCKSWELQDLDYAITKGPGIN